MKLINIAPIRLKRVPAGPRDAQYPDLGTCPEMVLATVTLTVNDGLPDMFAGQYTMDLPTRITTPPHDGDRSLSIERAEQLVLQALASQLRALADALDEKLAAG